MKPLLFCFFALVAASYLRSQEITSASLEEALKAARTVNSNLPANLDAPVLVRPDLELPQALKAGKAGMLVVPDEKFAVSEFATIGRELMPLGQLWMLNCVPEMDGLPTASEKLQTIAVNTDEKEVKVQLYLLSARKNESGGFELVIFSKGRQPLLRMPIAATTQPRRQRFPLELDARKRDEESGVVTLKILDGHTAQLPVVKPAD